MKAIGILYINTSVVFVHPITLAAEAQRTQRSISSCSSWSINQLKQFKETAQIFFFFPRNLPSKDLQTVTCYKKNNSEHEIESI